MDDDAMMAVGSVLAAIGGILERNAICTTMELAEIIGGVAEITTEAGPNFERRASYLWSWAFMVRAAAIGAGTSNQN